MEEPDIHLTAGKSGKSSAMVMESITESMAAPMMDIQPFTLAKEYFVYTPTKLDSKRTQISESGVFNGFSW